MSYKHYEMCPKQLQKVMRHTMKYGIMIDPDDLVEGQEQLCHLLCGSCGKIPPKTDIKECKNCMQIICDKCYKLGLTANDDEFLQKCTEGLGEDYMDYIRVLPDCP